MIINTILDVRVHCQGLPEVEAMALDTDLAKRLADLLGKDLADDSDELDDLPGEEAEEIESEVAGRQAGQGRHRLRRLVRGAATEVTVIDHE